MRKLCSVRVKILVATLLFSLLTILILTIFSFTYFENNAREKVIQSEEFNLQLVSSVIQERLTYVDSFSKWWAVQPTIATFLTSDGDTNSGSKVNTTINTYNFVRDEFSSNQASNYIRRLVFVDTNFTKAIQYRPITTIKQIPIDELKAYDKFDGDVHLWEEITEDPFPATTTNPVLSLVRPIYRTNSREIIGYIYMSVSTDIITDELKGYDESASSSLYIKQGNTFFSITNSSLNEVPASSIESEAINVLSDEETDASSGSIFRMSDDNIIVVKNELGIAGCELINVIHYEPTVDQNALSTRMLLFSCCGVFLLGILLTVIMGRIINTPVSKLRRKIDLVAKGDFSKDESIEWNNEFGNIGQGINQMSAEIVRLIEKQLQDEKQKRELEYQMLQSQINPHFLYNSLNSIKWMATIQGVSGIAEMTTALSRLLKNIAKGTKQVITLEEELSLFDDYVVIQQYRYGGTLTVTKDIPEELLHVQIPRFTLQPLIENAIFHGIEPKGNIGEIHVTAEKVQDDNTGDKIVISMTDNGVGMPEKTIQSLLSEGGNSSSSLFRDIGISNVHKRIQYLCGKEYGLSFSSVQGEYTTATITLPNKNQ